MTTRKINLSLILLLAILILSLISTYICLESQTDKTAYAYTNSIAKHSIDEAKSAILIEATSQRVLLQKDANIRLPMASTTKIMTALTVLANCKDLKEEIAVDDKAIGVEGSSIYLTKGEVLTTEQLLYGLMLRSGNDSAVALAIHYGGSVEGFAELMNQQAQLLQLKDTHFANPNGLPCDDHYTTAHELAIITAKAFQYPEFSEIVGCKKYQFTTSAGKHYCFYNENKLLSRMEDADGVKTGYTKKAGRCFVGSATRNNMRLIAVALNCGPMFEVCQAMLEYGLSNYTMANIVPQNKICGVQINGKQTKYYVSPTGFDYPIKNNSNEYQKISKKISLPDSSNNDQGKIEVFWDKQLIFSQKLVTI